MVGLQTVSTFGETIKLPVAVPGIPAVCKNVMIYAELPEGFAGEKQKLPFFLAMEEFLARQRGGEYFFMWQVAPTVIFGRNQDIEAEVNLDYCREHGIGVYRRKSGGGCVYADRNNIMFSHIATCGEVATTFMHYTSAVASMLRELGLDAATTGRNDIMIGDRKVSGYAFYNINLPHGARAVVHGTMLYDADIESMMHAITPSAVKLEAKGVASVRKRVTTVREHCGITLDGFKAFARRRLCDSVMTLTHADIAAIREIEQGYYESAWIYGKRRHRNLSVPKRIEGVGEFIVDMTLADGSEPPRIEALDITGDFFITGDIDAETIRPLTGCELTPEGVAAALSGVDLPSVIPNLSVESLTALLIDR